MMVNLDPRTIMFVTACMGPVLAMVLLSMRSNYASAVTGLGWWAQGTWWVFFGVIFVTLRDAIPLSLSVVVGNALIIIGTWHWLVGTHRFFGRRSHRQAWLVTIVLAIVGICWFYFVQPSFVARSVLIGAVMMALLVVHASTLLRQPNYTYASRFLSFALLMSALDWFIRMAGAIGGLLAVDLFAQSNFNATLNSIQTVAGLLILLGFVLLASDRVRHDFEMLAAKDSLTGALMRRAWSEAAHAELARARRHHRALSVIAMDLDHFKLINDSHGHAVGDQVLINVVAMVFDHLRKPDLLGRMGGEEFVLLLPETTLEDAIQVAERIRVAIQSLHKPSAVTVSMGVAQFNPVDLDLEAVLERADAALYRAKARGRNQVEREEIPLGAVPVATTPIKSALRRV